MVACSVGSRRKQLTVQVFSHLKRLFAGDGSLCCMPAIRG